MTAVSQKRKTLRKRLRELGKSEDEIAAIVNEKYPPKPQQAPDPNSQRSRKKRSVAAQLRARNARYVELEGDAVARQRARWEQETYRESDDRDLRQAPVDPLRNGAARVNDRTARAANRKNATLRTELEV